MYTVITIIYPEQVVRKLVKIHYTNDGPQSILIYPDSHHIRTSQAT